ncbi:MAG: PHP domain-containing protein [Anaerolineae bacterium]|nr:PHP domain-containing protein [Anaerolineae bacterium]
MIWKVDLHVHTDYSEDSFTKLPALIAACRRKGLARVAITDHNTIVGALAAQALAPDLIIVGQEIDTTQGELIAYFLREEVPRDLTPQEAIARLRQQGAVISVSHPFESLRASALARGALEEIIDQVDALEVFNARCLLQEDNRKAAEWAKRYGKLATAGSDAHTLWELGRGYVELPPFDGPEGFLRSLAQGRVGGRPSGLLVHFPSTLAKPWHRLRRR